MQVLGEWDVPPAFIILRHVDARLDPERSIEQTARRQVGAAGCRDPGPDIFHVAFVVCGRSPGDGHGGTILRYTASSQIGGKLAQIGSRLIEGTAKKMADDFFRAFAAVIAARPVDAAAAAASTLEMHGTERPGFETIVSAEIATVSTPIAPPETITHNALHPAIWITGLVAAVSGVLYFFARR